MKTAADTPQNDFAAPVALIHGQVIAMPLAMLMPDPDQPRTEFAEDTLAALAASIKARGMELPLLIRSDYVIKDGERRWRAAQRAGLTHVPCLLAAPATGPEDTAILDWHLDQVAVNHHREPLGPLDWARFLKKLVAAHGVAVKDLPALLAQRGVVLSRPYISNLMRLDELPDWAQALITAGALTASDGKHLLMARPHPPALTWLKQKIQQTHKRLDDDKSLHQDLFQYDYENMEDLVEHAYGATAIKLTSTWSNKAPKFKWQVECKGCDKRQAAGRDSHYCLDEKCFNEKQAQIKTSAKDKPESVPGNKKPKPRKPAGPTEVKPDENGVVLLGRLKSDKYNPLVAYGVRFEPAMHCTGCEHNHPAIARKNNKPEPTCFNPACFEQKQRNGNREEGIAMWLDKRLLPLVEAKLVNNYDLQFQVLAWMALGGPTQTDDETRVDHRLRDECHRARKRLNLRAPDAVILAYAAGNLNAEAIAAAGVRGLLADRGHFYSFARHLGIQLTPAIASLDAEYLDLKRKGELLALLAAAGQPDEDLVTGAALSKAKLNDIVEHCLTAGVIEAVGVPPDVQALYDCLTPVLDTDEDDDLDDEDEVSEETEDEMEEGENGTA